MKAELMKRWREREFGHPGLEHMADKAMDVAPSVVARWIIDIVADARELERQETFEHFVGLTYDPKDVEVTIGDGAGDPRKHEGFAMTTELAGSIERASVTITAEFIEGLWSTALPFKASRIDGAHEHGEVGRFLLWELSDGSVWAAADYKAVKVVKPDPELSSDIG